MSGSVTVAPDDLGIKADQGDEGQACLPLTVLLLLLNVRRCFCCRHGCCVSVVGVVPQFTCQWCYFHVAGVVHMSTALFTCCCCRLPVDGVVYVLCPSVVALVMLLSATSEP